jgi:undecaprenyl-diphosphatase
VRLDRSIAAAVLTLCCFIALATAVAQGLTMPFDEASRAALHSFAVPRLTHWMQLVTVFGSQLILLSVTACSAAALLALGRREAALRLAVVMGGAELAMRILKEAFHRPRPDPFFGALSPDSYSFPSGHALLSMSCYGALVILLRARLPRALLAPAYVATALLILAIGISRVYLGVHYSSDVIGGFLIAAAWLTALAPWRPA